MDEHVVGADPAHHVAVVGGQVLEAAIGSLDENLGLVAGAVQHALDAEHFVADGVAVAQRREYLVDVTFHAEFLAHDRADGILARISSAGGRFASSAARKTLAGARTSHRRRGPEPVSNCSNMSRYFFSITGHA